MAANLGSLVATITANTKPFSKGMKTAGGDMGKMQQSANKFSLKSMIAKIGLAAGAAIAFAKAIAAVKDQMAELDKLGKTADKLGIGVQQLEQLRFAAEQSGVASNTLDMALQRMVRRVNEAAHGTGEAKNALKEMGLSAKELAVQSPDQQMRVIADAMKKIQSPAERVRLAMKLFDSEGVSLVNTLSQGSAALDEQAAKFDKLNGVMSRADIKGVEDANDAMHELKVAIKGAWRSFTIAIAPVIKLLAKFITMTVQAIKFVSKFTGLGLLLKGLRKLSGHSQQKAIDNQKQLAPLLEDQLEKEKAIADEKAKAADALKKQGEAITREFMTPQEQFEEKVADLNRLVNAGAISWNIYNKAIGKAVDELKQANKQTDRLANPRKPIAAARRGTSAAFSAQRQSERHLKEMRDKQKQQVEEQKKTNQILANIDRNRSDLKVVNL